MKIQSVLINNYKGLNISLALSDGLNVITGRNGTGKSNILEAIRFALGLEDAEKKNVVTRGKSVASVKVTLADKGLILDKYSVLKKIYRCGRVKTYYSDTLPDDKIDCLLLDYDSHCFMELLKLKEFAKELKEKSKDTQIIIVTQAEDVINAADSVFKTERVGDGYTITAQNKAVA